MLLATGLYRASHLIGGLAAAVAGGTGLLLFGAALASSAALYLPAYRRGRLDRAALWADVVSAGCLVPFLALATHSAPVAQPGTWVMLLGSSACAAASAGLAGREAVGAVGLVVAVHTACCLRTGELRPLGGHLVSLLSSALMAYVLWRYLHRQGVLLDEARERAVRAEAARARRAERIAQHRALHDTVLATLTAVAQQRVDPTRAEFRERCAREASYLRRLIQRADEEDGPEGPDGEVAAGAALEQAVTAAEGIGLTIHARYHGLPTLPGPVARSLAAAVTEALNNVRHHAGTSTAHLTATGRGHGIAVTVVDDGRGFDPALRPADGTGLRRSIHARMAEIGGTAAVDSAPGEGTLVELRWPE
ncbi:sensor histidine kinase [Streptomyces rubellomurinus]|uniref:sensor histidine kinase n=1 Tax=Streptomyces rubellomurinus (strain ATCC 31215) TaxID=359131 RepID=UPI0006975E45|nr:ATP-binding protein [Streptomyces rubellomurinus]